MYLKPTKIQDACRALASRRVTILAGGTDHFAARVGHKPDEDVLDLTGLPALRGIRKAKGGWRIGAATTWSELLRAALPPVFDGLKLAASEIGGVQIQNAGTLAGNLCNASPAADGVPALLALDASVELCSARGLRVLPLHEFVLGPRKTALQPDELLSAILVPAPRHHARSHFLKLGARKYLVISIAMVAVVLETRGGVVRGARIAVGSCSPVARRLPELERELIGLPMNAAIGGRARLEHLEALEPIDDVRASAQYRLEAALTLVRRALNAVGRQS